MCEVGRQHAGLSSLRLPCRIQGSNSGHQGWQPLLLLAVLIISKCIKQSLAISPQSWANITAIHFQNFLSIPIRTLDSSNDVSHSISWVHHSTSWLSEAAVSSTSSQGTVKVWMWNVPKGSRVWTCPQLLAVLGDYGTFGEDSIAGNWGLLWIGILSILSQPCFASKLPEFCLPRYEELQWYSLATLEHLPRLITMMK